ncbi:hypothetical protein MMC07_009421, partial [Pseudocyphellaria aurata]|nr:hypothetical protein [Pseudocyphellaria aurata]
MLSVSTFFVCRPVKALWDFTLADEADCSTVWSVILGSVTNILGDLVILCLPQTVVWKLKMDRKSKIALAFTFLL